MIIFEFRFIVIWMEHAVDLTSCPVYQDMMKGNLSQRLWWYVNEAVVVKKSYYHVSSCIPNNMIEGSISQGGNGISVGDYAQVFQPLDLNVVI